MTLPVPVLTAWRTVQQLPSLDDYPALCQRDENAYLLTSRLRLVHDDLRLLVEKLERGEADDYPSLAADALEELAIFQPHDEDLGSDWMVREDVREVLVTAAEAYTDLARAIARLEGDAAHADTPPPAARPRRRTPRPLREAMLDWDPMDIVLTPENYKSDDIHELSGELNFVSVTIYKYLSAYQAWEPIDPSAGTEVCECIARCDELMLCEDLRPLDARHVQRITRYLAAARRVGEEFARMGRGTDVLNEIPSSQETARRMPTRVPLPDAVRTVWKALQELPHFDEHPALRDSKSTAYKLTVRLRAIRDELSVLVSGLEGAELLDYSTRAVDVLEELHTHDTRFEREEEWDMFGGQSLPYDLPVEAHASVFATTSAFRDVARAIAKVEDRAPPGIAFLIKGADRRSIPAEIRMAMGDFDPMDSNIAHADDHTAVRTQALERLLRKVAHQAMHAVLDITEWKPVKSSVGADIQRLVDECMVLLADAEVAHAVTKQRRKVDAFLLRARAMAGAFTKWSSERPRT